MFVEGLPVFVAGSVGAGLFACGKLFEGGVKIWNELVGCGAVVVVDWEVDWGVGVFVEVGDVGGACGVGGELARG